MFGSNTLKKSNDKSFEQKTIQLTGLTNINFQ